ncbi:lasso peptide biosynthesis B2 protein [Peribacillus sp. SCS-37]|uniref:lasso peptide biosynthesis B2 protein n=1 Tax=Paraperibacillus esterisolvens TaxID=3115296 RepID=UPI0039059BE4
MLESVFYLGWARILKSIPFSKTVKTLGDKGSETSYVEKGDRFLLRDISSAISTASRYTAWESKCLVQAIAAMKMLERRGIDSTLYLGTARDTNGNMVAHAWLRSGPYYITGSDGMEYYTVVSQFAKRFDSRVV